MSRILVSAAFLFALILAVPGPANASERRADGARSNDMTEFSAQWRVRRAYRPGLRRAAWGGYPGWRVRRAAAWGGYPGWRVRRAAVWGGYPGWRVRRAAYWGGGWGPGYGAWGYPYAYPAASVVVVRPVPVWGVGWGAWGPGFGWGWGRRVWW
jgi:hypothetical protein